MRKFTPLRLSSALSIVLFSTVSSASGSVIYVDAEAVGPTHDGSSWCSAYVHLQDALADASSSGGVVAEIHVADGIYTPDQGSDQTPGDREATFQLLNGVAIMGGYAGCGAPNPDDRDIAAYETALSGDLNGDDANATESDCCHAHLGVGCDNEVCQDLVCATDGYDDCCTGGWRERCADLALSVCGSTCSGDTTDNSYNVTFGASVSATAVIDGVVIESGNANQFSHPHRDSGGGMYIAGSPTVTRCAFRNCHAAWRGAAIYNAPDSAPRISNCTFTGNTGGLGAAGMGIYNDQRCHPVVINCLFTANLGHGGTNLGGAIYNYDSSITLIGCDFVGNVVDAAGGAMGNDGPGTITVLNCRFMNNSSGWLGGAVVNLNDPTTTFTDCLFAGNTAEDGGAIWGRSFHTLALVNCTIVNNSAGDRGGALSLRYDAAGATLSNCIVWDNSDSEGSGAELQVYHEAGSSEIAVNYSCIQGGWAGDGGVGNIDLDPRFVDASSGNLRLLPGSPCIDAGDNTALPADEFDLDDDGDTSEPIPFDLDGLARFLDDPAMPDTGNGTAPIVDMGAFEKSDDCNLNGVPDVVDLLDGTSADCNENAAPDECDIAGGGSTDCNANNVPDDCEIADGNATDCNGNALPDACDLAAGTNRDCNGNTTLDDCDIAAGTSADTDGNGVPDECQGQPVPAVSSWGLLILALMLLCAGKAVAMRRRCEPT